VIYRLIRNSRQMSSQKPSFSFNHSCVSSMQLCPCFLKQNSPNFLTGWMDKCWSESAVLILNARYEIIDYDLCCNSINLKINDIDASTVYLFSAKEWINQFLVLWDCLQHCEEISVSNRTSDETFCIIDVCFEFLLWIHLRETLPNHLTKQFELIRV
jgi:hypothetical protein